MARNSYTGIGSRKTPDDVLIHMMDLATELEELGYILRSGAAVGADSAFECGVKNPDNVEIYLPWRGFEGHPTGSHNIVSKAFDIAAIIHPAWDKLKQGARKLHARNIRQVFGADVSDPSKFVICWTSNGKEVGGTRTAIVAARLQSIPVYNLADKLWSVKEMIEGKSYAMR